MRVEVTFAGDAAGAQESAALVVEALKKLFSQADATGLALKEVKITAGQATETDVNVRRMKDSLQGLDRQADQTRRSLERVKIATAGSGLLGGILPGGARPGVAAVGALAGLGVSAAGPVGLAGLGVLAALPGVLAAGGAAAGVLAGSFQGLGAAIGGNKKAFDDLDQSAQQFVQTIRSLEPWAERLQETMRQGLLPGLSAGLHDALTPANAQAFQTAAGQIAKALGDIGTEWGKSLGSPAFTAGFSTVMSHGAANLRLMGDAADHLAGALGKVTVAGLPLTDWLTKEVDLGARFLDNWAAAGQASGKLASGLEQARHELELVAKFAGALLDAVFQLVRALTPLGNVVLAGVTHELQNLAGWISRNRTEIESFTTGALHDVEAAAHVVEGAFHLLADAMGGGPQGTLHAFEALAAAFAAWKVAGIVGNLTAIGAAAGETGAASQFDILISRVRTLAKLALAPIAIAVVISAVNKLTGSSGVDTSTGTAPDVVQPGNPYAQGSENYYAYAAGASGVKPKNGRVALPGGGTDSATNPAYLRGVHDRSTGTISTSSQNAAASSLPGVPAALASAITAAAAKYGVSPQVLAGIWHMESGSTFPNPAVNSSGYGGLFGTTDWNGSTQSQANLSASILANLLKQSGGDLPAALLKYSGGGYSSVPGLSSSTPVHTSSGGRTTSPAGGASPFGTPPPFTAGLAGFALPTSIQLAMAKNAAVFGANSPQEITALRQAIAWVNANLKTFTGADAVAAWSELASLNQQVAGIVQTLPTVTTRHGVTWSSIARTALMGGSHVLPTVTTQTGTTWSSLASAALAGGTISRYPSPSQASSIGIQGSITSLLGLLNHPVTAGAPADPMQAVQQAQTVLANLRSKLTPEITAIKKKLTDPWITASDEAALKAQLTQYTGHVTTAVQNLSAALATERSQFQQAWVAAGEAAKQQLENAAATWESPSQILLDQITSAHDSQQLQDQLAAAQQNLADALVGTPDNSAIVDNIKAILGQQNLADAIDRAQSAILGVAPGGVNSSLLLQRLTAATTAAATPDPAQVAQAQQQVADAQYQIQVAGLQKTAAAETTAHQQQLQDNENQITQLEGQWESFFTYLGGNINAIPSAWQSMLAQLGINVPGGGASPSSPQDLINAALAAPTDAAAAAAAGYPIINGVQWTPAAELAAQAVQVAQTRALKGAYGPGGPPQLHAKGGIAVGPIYRNVIGEAGPEAIIPLSDPRAAQMLGGGGAEVHIHGNIPEDWFQVQVAKPRNAAAISRSLGGRASERLRSGRR